MLESKMPDRAMIDRRGGIHHRSLDRVPRAMVLASDLAEALTFNVELASHNLFFVHLDHPFLRYHEIFT
jgi:hypothetical protein